MSNGFGIDEIKKHIPHRFPFLLVDRVVEYTAGESLVAIKNVSVNEPFFNGHFPDYPVMPGVLMIEALAQASAILMSLTEEDGAEGKLMFLVGVKDVKFKYQVRPGDQLKLDVKIERKKRDFVKFSGVITVDGQLACSAQIDGLSKAP